MKVLVFLKTPWFLRLACGLAFAVGCAFPETLRGEDLIGAVGGYVLKVVPVEGRPDFCAVLTRNGQEVARGEDVHQMLAKCADPATRKTLTDIFIQRELLENGGREEFQKIANINMRNFGPTFYSYLGQEVLDAYRRNGVNLGVTKGEEAALP